MIRVGVIGAGWSGRVHALAAIAAPNTTLAWVSGGGHTSAQTLADDLGVPLVSIADASDGVDTVVIATPPDTHAQLALDALGRGCPVVVEGPIADSLDGADRIIDEAEARQISVGIAVNALFAPVVGAMIARLGDVGPLRHLGVEAHHEPPADGYRSATLRSGGVLTEVGIPCIAMALAVAADDPVTGVRAALDSTRPDGADDLARVELKHASGLVSVVDCSWRAERTTWHLQAATDSHVVRAELVPRARLEVNGDEVPLSENDDPDDLLHALGFVAQIDGFAAALSGRGGRVSPAGFGRMLLEVAYAAYRSAGTGGEEVGLPFDGPRSVPPMSLWRGDIDPDA